MGLLGGGAVLGRGGAGQGRSFTRKVGSGAPCSHRGGVGGLGGLRPQAAVLGVEGGEAVAQAALLCPAALRAVKRVAGRSLSGGGQRGAAQAGAAGPHLKALGRGARLVGRQALSHSKGPFGGA